MKSPDCVAIMAILTEMVKRVNENITKVELKPLPLALGTNGATHRTSIAKARKA